MTNASFSFAGDRQPAAPPSPAMLRRLRRMAEVSQGALAAAMGVSAPRLCQLENQKSCSLAVAMRYLRVLAALRKGR